MRRGLMYRITGHYPIRTDHLREVIAYAGWRVMNARDW